MSRIEEFLLGRWSGLKIIGVSAAIGVAGLLPLALYVAIGPEDGNPIGLGLLVIVAMPVAGLGLLIGMVKLLVERFTDRGR